MNLAQIRPGLEVNPESIAGIHCKEALPQRVAMRMCGLKGLCNTVMRLTAVLILIGVAGAQNSADKCSGLPDNQKLKA
ncbi:MAG TPA: hypothetical protein VIJ01_13165, partial [Candidatus Angelobacter sp.]